MDFRAGKPPGAASSSDRGGRASSVLRARCRFSRFRNTKLQPVSSIVHRLLPRSRCARAAGAAQRCMRRCAVPAPESGPARRNNPPRMAPRGTTGAPNSGHRAAAPVASSTCAAGSRARSASVADTATTRARLAWPRRYRCMVWINTIMACRTTRRPPS